MSNFMFNQGIYKCVLLKIYLKKTLGPIVLLKIYLKKTLGPIIIVYC